MTNTDPEQPEQRAAENAAAEAAASEETDGVNAQSEDGSIEEPQIVEPQIVETRVEVSLQRSVRYSRLLIGGAVLGAALLAIISMFFPVTEESEYTLGQIVGFMALIGAVFGLALGGLLGLVLGAVAKRQSGTGVAIQADVQ